MEWYFFHEDAIYKTESANYAHDNNTTKIMISLQFPSHPPTSFCRN